VRINTDKIQFEGKFTQKSVFYSQWCSSKPVWIDFF